MEFVWVWIALHVLILIFALWGMVSKEKSASKKSISRKIEPEKIKSKKTESKKIKPEETVSKNPGSFEDAVSVSLLRKNSERRRKVLYALRIKTAIRGAENEKGNQMSQVQTQDSERRCLLPVLWLPCGGRKKEEEKKENSKISGTCHCDCAVLGILLAIAVGSQKKQIQGWKERQLEEWKQKQEKVQADEGDQSQKQNKNQNGEQSQDSQDVKEPGTMKKCANGDTVYQPSVSTVSYDEDTGLLYYENLLIVYLIENSSQEEREALAAKVDGTLVGNMSGSMNVIEILVEDTAYADLEQKAEILMEEENVLYSSTEIPMMMENTADENPWEAGEQDKKNNDHNESKPDGNDWWAEAIGAFSAWDYVDSHEQDLANVAVGIMDDVVDADTKNFRKTAKVKFTGWKITKKIWHLTMAHM